MNPTTAALTLMVGGCAAAQHAPAPRPDCDTTGVWHVAPDDAAGPAWEVTFDPRLLRVASDEEAVGGAQLLTAVDGATCRGHVLTWSAIRRGAEGYEDEDVTIRLDFALAPGAQRVRGVIHRVVFDPSSTSTSSFGGVARRQVGWSDP